jgi:hypothetical protein
MPHLFPCVSSALGGRFMKKPTRERGEPVRRGCGEWGPYADPIRINLRNAEFKKREEKREGMPSIPVLINFLVLICRS